ncbi:hypothetical protein XM52_06270 [Roseovarius indicus]|uniref:Uncharacterized protein n=1 Tax=Roseovarius indicus TaxID=540747 RepID=A0A0T5PBJ5_9RHOB|nr:hypothetical protein XM52_06270 [Roseovarius indicus]
MAGEYRARDGHADKSARITVIADNIGPYVDAADRLSKGPCLIALMKLNHEWRLRFGTAALRAGPWRLRCRISSVATIPGKMSGLM